MLPGAINVSGRLYSSAYLMKIHCRRLHLHNLPERDLRKWARMGFSCLAYPRIPPVYVVPCFPFSSISIGKRWTLLRFISPLNFANCGSNGGYPFALYFQLSQRLIDCYVCYCHHNCFCNTSTAISELVVRLITLFAWCIVAIKLFSVPKVLSLG